MSVRTVEIASVSFFGLLAGGGAIIGFLDTGDPVFLVIGVVVLLLAAAGAIGLYVGPVFHRRGERRRAAELGAWAAANGWSFGVAPLTPPDRNHAPGTRLRLGTNMLLEASTDGTVVSVGESSHLESGPPGAPAGQTGRPRAHYEVIAGLWLGTGWPDVAVRPQRPQLGRALIGLAGSLMHVPPSGYRVGYGDFDERFQLVFRDPAASSVLSRALLDAHLAGGVGPWRIESGELVVYRSNLRLTPAGVLPAAAYVRHVASLLARP